MLLMLIVEGPILQMSVAIAKKAGAAAAAAAEADNHSIDEIPTLGIHQRSRRQPSQQLTPTVLP